ncbi:MAG: ATP-binding protein [Gammaproteobacteria bacterium]|nr:ATP-binding protein [Gammaproteobacteria bacterium]
MARRKDGGGKLRIGDHWSAISIIAQSQDNPLKAVAEFVENSIDAGAKSIRIVRGRERGEPFLKITDDGEGIRLDETGAPDFRYVATHICDSIKRRLKRNGARQIQGEFGIGLLSFWTLGENLKLRSSAADGSVHEMAMQRGSEGYSVRVSRALLAEAGATLDIRPLLPGVRQFSGEKLNWYLASELRDRIRQTGVCVRISDRTARKSYAVTPREFDGRLIHELNNPVTRFGEIRLELYLDDPSPERGVSLYRNGTRVAELAALDGFQEGPWSSGYIDGAVDAPFIHLTPGTRTGVIHDEAYAALREGIESIRDQLDALIGDLKRAEEERASERTLKSIRRAFREAMLALPAEEYDWFEVHRNAPGRRSETSTGPALAPTEPQREVAADDVPDADEESAPKQAFFDMAGPLYSVRISPASSVVRVGTSRTLRAVCRDRAGRQVDEGVVFAWTIVQGGGSFADPHAEIVDFEAPRDPGLVTLKLVATQRDVVCEARALVTVTDSLVASRDGSPARHGLPGYTYENAPGQLWRSRYELDRELIVINNGHRDFVFASRTRASQLRYIARLFVKELVIRNFPGSSSQELLDRMLELMLYMEGNLK